MGNQNHSVARKRLSTLAITTTLAAVGVGVVGTGAANAATPQANSGNTKSNPVTSVKTVIALAVTADAKDSKGVVDLTGTTIDAKADFTTAQVSINWGDKTGPDTTSITVKADGTLSSEVASHLYTDLTKDYTVTVTIIDGVNTPSLSKSGDINFVADPVLKAALTPTSSVKKNTPVTLSLAGSSVDKAAAKTAQTTVDWGDKTSVATLTGDPANLSAADAAKLTHSFAADGSYTVTVKLDDGLGNPNSMQSLTFTVKVSETTGVQVLQAAGATRYETGVQISKHQWATATDATDTRTKAKAVVLATGNDFADALVAVPLAKKVQGPLLLTDGLATKTNPVVLAEIQRVLPTKDTKIFLLGGTAALNTGIENELKGLGYTTERLAGTDRFATALDVATSKDAMNDPSHIIVARGDEGSNHDGFADALAAGPFAANVFGGGDSAIVLSNFKTFDPATQAYVKSKLHAGQQDVAAIGGQAVAAMTTIPGSAGTYAPAFGATRYETAAVVASHFPTKNAQIGFATGTVFADALTGGAYQATVGGPLLLTDPKVLPAASAAAVAGFTTQEINIFGGDKAISPAVAKEIAALVKVTTIGKF